MPIPTWRLAALAATGAVFVWFAPIDAGGAVVGVNALVLLAGLVDGLRAPAPGSLRIRRELPGVIPLDGTATLRWEVRNSHGHPVQVTIADALAPSLRAERRRVVLRLPARGTVRAETGLNPSRRGRFTLSEVTVRVEGPWRLVARQGSVTVPDVLRVYPPFHSREEAELRIDRARILEVGLRSAQGRGGGTEFESLREYSIDDEYRKIDWGATARTGKPIVRTYRAERNQTLLCLLDTGRLMAARVRDPSAEGAAWGDVPRLDHAMDAVMMLTAVSTRLGDRAGLVAFSERVRTSVAPGHARDQLSRVTESMYELEPELVESDYAGAFAHTLARFRRRALLVVLTELAPEPVNETLLPALPLVLRSHLVLIAGVRDPAVDRWARSQPGDASTAFRKASAVASLDDRRRMVARLRSLGAVVVDEPPGRLAPSLADAYLRAKATGRL